MVAHRKAVTAEELAQLLGAPMPEKAKGPCELSLEAQIAKLEEPNEALAALALSLAQLMDNQPSASTARQLRETVIALATLVPKVAENKEAKSAAESLIEAIKAA